MNSPRLVIALSFSMAVLLAPLLVLVRIRLPGEFWSLRRKPRHNIRDFLRGHWPTRNVSSPIRRTQIGPSGYHDRAQLLITDQRQIRSIHDRTALPATLPLRPVARRAKRSVHLSATLGVARRLRRVGRKAYANKLVRPSPGTNSMDKHVDLLLRQHSPCTLGKRRHRSSIHSLGGNAPDRVVVRDRQVNRVVQADRCSAFAFRAVAAGAVLFKEDVEIQQLVRANHFRARAGTAGRVVASGHDEDRRDPGEPRPETYARTRAVHRSALPSFSLMIPGASIPARTANGRNCRVRTRSWRTTTSPATTPNPI